MAAIIYEDGEGEAGRSVDEFDAFEYADLENNERRLEKLENGRNNNRKSSLNKIK